MSIASKDTSSFRLRIILLSAIAVITFLCYSRTLSNRFTNWDDGLYVETNPYIKNLTSDNMKMILFHNITNNYYHPITMLTIAANYHFSKMEPFGYYLTNVTIHALNTCVMFLLVFMLLEAMEEKGYGKMKGKEWLAALGALLYGIHPMHVESVSWLAERKDVMYGFFYFLGLIAYLKYLKEDKIKWMVYVVILFLCSLLSKPMAVVFPLSLIALDVLLKRKFTAKSIIEKLPMLLISVAAGIWAYKAQVSSGAVGSFTFLQKILVASYGFVMYIVKAFVPINLSAYYPYPTMANLPAIYYLMPFIAILIIVLPVYLARKAGENQFRVILFGLAFYVVNVVMVLQFISSGPAMMADRYTYISYFGIFFILIYFIQQFWEKRPSMHMSVKAASAGFVAMLAFLCFNRTKVWHNTETLFKDVVAKYPNQAELAYINLGAYYGAKGDINNAYKDYKMLADMHSSNPIVYNNLGNIYSQRRQFDSALGAYSQAIALDSKDFHPYVDRGMTYARERRYDLALQDYNHAFQLDSTAEKLLSNRAEAYFMTKQYPLAAADYSRAIGVNPAKADYYFDRGICEMNLGDLYSAGVDFTRTLSIDPNNRDCIFDMSLLYNKAGDYSNALMYANKAKDAGYKVSDEYINSLRDKAISPQ